jgi:hypothetical protein
MRRLIAALLCLFLCTHTSVSDANSIDCDSADQAASNVTSWHGLRVWFESYPGCDDGGIAETLAEFITSTLAHRWNTLPELAAEVKYNSHFLNFVIRHLGVAECNDNRDMVLNAERYCNQQFEPICKAISRAARSSAVKDCLPK